MQVLRFVLMGSAPHVLKQVKMSKYFIFIVGQDNKQSMFSYCKLYSGNNSPGEFTTSGIEVYDIQKHSQYRYHDQQQKGSNPINKRIDRKPHPADHRNATYADKKLLLMW